MNKHTPEPWKILTPNGRILSKQQEGDRLIFAAGDRIEHIAETFQYRNPDKTDAETSIANAKHIVECVNGCEGISKPESTVLNMLTVLRQTLPYLDHPNVQAMGFAVPVSNVARNVRDILAKAKGETS